MTTESDSRIEIGETYRHRRCIACDLTSPAGWDSLTQSHSGPTYRITWEMMDILPPAELATWAAAATWDAADELAAGRMPWQLRRCLGGAYLDAIEEAALISQAAEALCRAQPELWARKRAQAEAEAERTRQRAALRDRIAAARAPDLAQNDAILAEPGATTSEEYQRQLSGDDDGWGQRGDWITDWRTIPTEKTAARLAPIRAAMEAAAWAAGEQQ